MGGNHGGFSRLHEHRVFEGHLIALGTARFSAPDGTEFEREIVHHPGAVSVVAIEPPDVAVLVRQYRPAIGQYVLELPAGTCDVANELPERTAGRELAEEVGLEAARWERLTTILNSPGYTDQTTAIYLASDLRPCPTRRDGIEERWMQVDRMRLGDLPAMVAGGRIVDATTTVGLLLARDRTKNH